MARLGRRFPVNRWNGQDATKRAVSAGGSYTVTADAGAYTLSGQDAALTVGRLLTADAGAYSLAGQDATLLRGRVVSADAGAYALAGQDASLSYVPTGSTYTLTCDAGAYALAGQAASLLLARVMSADAGAYSIGGQDATVSWSGEPAVTTTRRRGFAGFPRSHLWIAHINGKRYVGTYEELEAALGEVVEKTARKPRIVIKPGRVISRGVAQPVVATVEQAKAVQQQLTIDIGPLLSAAVRQREEDEDEDLMLLL